MKPLADTKWPGRCQSVPDGVVTWLLDGAHTVESLTSCGEWAWSSTASSSGTVSPKDPRPPTPNVLVFNCSGGRAGETLLGALLDAGAKTANLSREELGKTFIKVVFCTNVTYSSGEFKGDLTAHAIDPNDLSALATQTQLADAWRKINPDFQGDVHVVPSIEHAVKIVRETEGAPAALVAGSLHLVGGVMEVAGLQDALSMV